VSGRSSPRFTLARPDADETLSALARLLARQAALEFVAASTPSQPDPPLSIPTVIPTDRRGPSDDDMSSHPGDSNDS
jgi:hypothetical protein